VFVSGKNKFLTQIVAKDLPKRAFAKNQLAVNVTKLFPSSD
jgi:hypothetical protein